MSCNTVPIFIIGNDQILPEVVRFLASVQKYQPNASIRFIPFDDNSNLCKEVVQIFSHTIVEQDLTEFNDFGHAIFDGDPPQQPYPYMLGKMRKMLLFQQPGEAIYIDVDTILVSPLFDTTSRQYQAHFDLGYISPSKAWIYEDVPEAAPFHAITKGFSSGFLFKRGNGLNFDLIREVILTNLNLYKKIRRRGVIDQPLLNFVVDHCGKTAASLPDLLGISAHTVATSESVSFKVRLTPGGEVIQTWQGKEYQVPFLHAVGKYKHNSEYDYLFKSNLYSGVLTVSRQDKQLAHKLLSSIDEWAPR